MKAVTYQKLCRFVHMHTAALNHKHTQGNALLMRLLDSVCTKWAASCLLWMAVDNRVCCCFLRGTPALLFPPSCPRWVCFSPLLAFPFTLFLHIYVKSSFLFLVFFVPCILCPFFFFFFFSSPDIIWNHLSAAEATLSRTPCHKTSSRAQTRACLPLPEALEEHTHTHTHTLAPSHFPSVDGGNAPAPKGISRSSSQSCCQPACHRGDRMLR